MSTSSADVFFCASGSLPHDKSEWAAERVAHGEALRWLDQTWRGNAPEFRRFGHRIDLADSQMWTRLEDHQVLAVIARQIEHGRVVVLVRRRSHAASATRQALDQQLQVVREVRRATAGRLLVDGVTYELVVGASIGGGPVSDGVQVVAHDDASAILSKLIAAPASSISARDALTQARLLLSPDWRRPAPPDGLVLLQTRVVRAAGVSSDEPPMTPAAFRAALTPTLPRVALPKLAPPRLSDLLPKIDLTFSAAAALNDVSQEETPAREGPPDQTSEDLVPIEIDLFAATGEPLPGIAYSITLPDGTVRSGHADDSGFIRIPDNTQTGDLTLTLDDFEAQKAA